MSALKPLVLVGCGGFARETLEAVWAVNEREPTWDVRGFVDDDPSLHGRSVKGVPVLGEPESHLDGTPEAHVLLSPGSWNDYSARRRLEARLGLEEARCAIVVHPSAVVPSSVEVGGGTVVLAGAVATGDSRIGRHCAVLAGVVINHDVSVGAFANLTPRAVLNGAVVLEEECYIGAAAVVAPGVRIGAGSLLGMASVAWRDIPPGEVWLGNPARKLHDAPARG